MVILSYKSLKIEEHIDTKQFLEFPHGIKGTDPLVFSVIESSKMYFDLAFQMKCKYIQMVNRYVFACDELFYSLHVTIAEV